MFSSRILLLALVTSPTLLTAVEAADVAVCTRTADVIYGRKSGTALTMDVFTPEGPSVATGRGSGAGVIFAVSGGWFSAREMISAELYQEFLRRGYTVFAVVHGSQPKFTIPEVLEDMHRAVRFIRYNAAQYKIDPERLGISGGSAGGHLSLMIATSGGPGHADAKDPVDRASSRVKVVGCYFPPTDFLNYGQDGRDVFKALKEELAAFKAPFDFEELDTKARRFVLISDPARRVEIAGQISPVTHVTPDDPPTLILHGDNDKLVPIQQAQQMQRKLEQVGVPMKLVLRPGQGHGWPDWQKDMAIIADWFDTYIGKPATTQPR